MSHCDKYITTAENLRSTLNTFGVAIIPNVLNQHECNEMIDCVWSYF